ncbi:MAG: hypothetical protein ACT4OJ_14280 [Bacteroidota bacterium]
MSTVKTYLPGRTFYLLLSDDNWTTTYTLVCLSKQGLKRNRPVTKQDSQCGQAKAYGEVDRMMDVEAINNLTPDAVAAGVGEASYKKIASWFEANTALKMRRKTPSDGSQLYQESACKLASLDDSAGVAENMTFSFTLELEGDLDETA